MARQRRGKWRWWSTKCQENKTKQRCKNANPPPQKLVIMRNCRNVPMEKISHRASTSCDSLTCTTLPSYKFKLFVKSLFFTHKVLWWMCKTVISFLEYIILCRHSFVLCRWNAFVENRYCSFKMYDDEQVLRFSRKTGWRGANTITSFRRPSFLRPSFPPRLTAPSL
jgi:hypothetical protein